MSKKIDLTGKRFGKLVVVKEMEERNNNGRVLWLCECDCGNLITVIPGNLISGNTKGCGCLRSTQAVINGRMASTDLSGKKFGRLTVLKETDKRASNGIMWLCRCECGNFKEVETRCLNNGNTQSCGCFNVETSKETQKKLYKHNLAHEFVEETFLSLLTQKKRVDNKSGVKGVSWSNRQQRWRACIGLKGKQIDLGLFDNLEDATKARKEAEEKYFRPILEEYGRGEELNKSV